MANLNFESIQINPAVMQWGNQSMQKVVITTAAGLGAQYFNLNAPDESFYVWMNTGSDTDPAVSGKTGIEVTIGATPTILTVASALATELNTGSDFNAKAYTQDGVTYVLIQAKAMGAAVAASDGTATTTWTFSEIRAGSLLDIGLTEDIEVGFSMSVLDVTASQLGTTVVERLRNGMNIENISINMKESVAAKIKAIMEPYYPAYTPGSGTEVQGIGNAKDFLNVSADSAKLVLHPKKLADGNLAEDFAFWRACPMLTSMNFSGESEQMMSVEFSVLPDKFLVQDVAHGVYGDHTQNFLK